MLSDEKSQGQLFIVL